MKKKKYNDDDDDEMSKSSLHEQMHNSILGQKKNKLKLQIYNTMLLTL